MAMFITKEVAVEVKQFDNMYHVFSGEEGDISRIEMSRTDFLRFLQPDDHAAHEMHTIALQSDLAALEQQQGAQDDELKRTLAESGQYAELAKVSAL